MSKEQASMNPGPGVTILMVKPLSKRAQLLSPSILTLVMFLGPLHWVSELGFKKGTFWDAFRLWKPHLGMQVGWLLISEGSGLPSLSSPFLHLKSLSRWSCWYPSDNLSQDGQDYHIWNNFSFSSDTAWPHWQNGWYTQPTDLLLWLNLRFLGSLHLKTQPLLPPLPCAWVFYNSVTFYHSWSGSEGMTSLQPLGGKHVPDVYEQVTFDPLIGVAFESRRSLASADLSNFQGARGRSEYLVGCSPSTLLANIHHIQGSGHHRSDPAHLLHVLLLDPSRILWSILTCCNICILNLAMFSPDPCLRK